MDMHPPFFWFVFTCQRQAPCDRLAPPPRVHSPREVAHDGDRTSTVEVVQDYPHGQGVTYAVRVRSRDRGIFVQSPNMPRARVGGSPSSLSQASHKHTPRDTTLNHSKIYQIYIDSFNFGMD